MLIKREGGDTVIRRKYVVLSLLTLVYILLGGLLYSNLVQAQSTVTGYVSVPAAAFVPGSSGWAYVCNGTYISLQDTYGQFYAPVELPHGATVTKVTVYWYDGGAGNVWCELRRFNSTDYKVMAGNMESSGAPGLGSSHDDTIAYATIDNSRYAYFLEVRITGQPNYGFKYAVVEHTLPSVPVGGLYIPVDKFSLLAPYIALVSTIILAVSISVAYIKIRKKQ